MSQGTTALRELLRGTVEEVRRLADPSMTVGDPITAGDTTVIPVSKASFGFAGGGADQKETGEKWTGGAGARAEVTPLCFLVIRDGAVSVVSPEESAPPAGGLAAVSGLLSRLIPDKSEKKADRETKSAAKQAEKAAGEAKP